MFFFAWSDTNHKVDSRARVWQRACMPAKTRSFHVKLSASLPAANCDLQWLTAVHTARPQTPTTSAGQLLARLVSLMITRHTWEKEKGALQRTYMYVVSTALQSTERRGHRRMLEPLKCSQCHEIHGRKTWISCSTSLLSETKNTFDYNLVFNEIDLTVKESSQIA